VAILEDREKIRAGMAAPINGANRIRPYGRMGTN
jgi:hypothetical protein